MLKVPFGVHVILNSNKSKDKLMKKSCARPISSINWTLNYNSLIVIVYEYFSLYVCRCIWTSCTWFHTEMIEIQYPKKLCITKYVRSQCILSFHICLNQSNWLVRSMTPSFPISTTSSSNSSFSFEGRASYSWVHLQSPHVGLIGSFTFGGGIQEARCSWMIHMSRLFCRNPTVSHKLHKRHKTMLCTIPR